MAVIIKYDEKNNPTFRSAKGIGSSDEERTRARMLDQLTKDKLVQLEKRLKKEKIVKKNSKASVDIYWELGMELRSIIDNTKLLDISEQFLYWSDVNLHLPEIFRAKDRGPNRIHVEYCYRLSGVDKELSKKLNWGEWVFLFDSPTINKELRFDAWFSIKLSEYDKAPSRDEIRTFVLCLNGLLGKMETKDLQDSQLLDCYEAAWRLGLKWVEERPRTINDKLLRDYLKIALKDTRTEFVRLIERDITVPVYSSLLWQQFVDYTLR